MSERALRTGTAALAIAGAAITAYLLVVRSTGATLACTTGGCETVQHSRYAEVLGIPVAALGLVGYLALAAAAAARGEAARIGQGVVALAAFAFGAWLLYVQLHVIGSVCDWCLASDVLTTGLAALALLRLTFEDAVSPPVRAPAPR